MSSLLRTACGVLVLSCLSCTQLAAPLATATKGSTAASSAADKRKALARAFYDLLPSTEFAKSQTTLGVVGKGGGILSDGASGVISNNGGGIISDNGLGYRIAAAGQELAKEKELDTAPSLHAIIRVYKPDYGGEVLGYDRAAFAAQREAAPLLEHYVWDKLAIVPKSISPLKLAITYPFRVVKSNYFPYVKTMTIQAEATATDPKDMTTYDIHPVGGVVHTETPIEAGGVVATDLNIEEYREVPDKYLRASAKNDRGKLELVIERKGDDRVSVTSTHTSPDNVSTKLSQDLQADGGSVRTLSLLDGSLVAELTLGADHKGSGKVYDAAHQELGAITWNDKGGGTMTFKDGATYPVAIF